MSKTINKDAINDTIALITARKDLDFDMSNFVETNECGTACCLAGYASIAQYGSLDAIPISYVNRDGVHFRDYYTTAMEYFGLSKSEADALFIPKTNGHINNTNKNTAILVLETLRDTGKIIWDDLPRPVRI
jgi:hypothetical protein